jgi:hypothetical protein
MAALALSLRLWQTDDLRVSMVGSRILDSSMSRTGKHQAWKSLTAIALLFALVVVLLPHPHHISVSMACPFLVVVFLFGTIDASVSLRYVSPVNEECSFQSPDLPFRFQRPPPAFF